jgi:hypothetical protein
MLREEIQIASLAPRGVIARVAPAARLKGLFRE